MQFHASTRTNVVSVPVGTINPRIDAASTRRLEAESVLPQPGRLLAIKQHAHHLHQLQQHGSPVPLAKKVPPNNQRSIDKKTTLPRRNEATIAIKPEPINYLKLRRTDESARAIHRNRTQLVVTHEILQPLVASPTTLSLPKRQATIAEEGLMDRFEALDRMDHVLAEMQDHVLHTDKGETANQARFMVNEDSSALLASQLKQLQFQQTQVQKESEAATKKMQDMLTVVRNDISLMYKFTPLFKIYARHKVKSAMHRWSQYAVWHREEEARLALLWPYAVTIQRVFRTKRSRWLRARMRMALAWQQWEASLCVQRLVRGWLGRKERDRLAEAREANKLQAAWRGRRDRRWVKKVLQDQIRMMLRSLTPTGNLHRLHEVTQRSPELARPLNAMLSLIEETNIAVETSTTYQAKNTRVAAKNAARAVEATRKQLFHAIFELSEIIKTRDRAVQDAKAAFNAKQEEKQQHQRRQEDAVKAQQLLLVREKIAANEEGEKMRREEMLTHEFIRMLKTADADQLLRVKLNQSRREQAENARMVIEEYQTRYLVSEIRRRRAADEKRLGEVAKRQQFLLDFKREQAQQLMALLKADELKRNEVRTKRLQSQAEANEVWLRMSKEQRTEAMRRLELREQVEDEVRKRSEASVMTEQAHQRELDLKRGELRQQKQAELERELAARAAMEREEKCSRKVHFEQKKALHAGTWKTKREKERVRYSLDPMHFDKVQATRILEERERRERYMMKVEDGIMAHIHERERKDKYFEMCRQRRKQDKADATRAEKERAKMSVEETHSEAIRAVERKAEEQKVLLGKMAVLAKQDEIRRAQPALEARNRKDMRDEEMRQRRVALSIHFINEARETRERDVMAQEDILACAQKQKVDKRFREQCSFRMMREDVESMERHDWEEEGHRLAQLLWTPADTIAFSTLVTVYPTMLSTNVAIVRELCSLKGLPPFNFDYEAVQHHRRDEATLPPDNVPRKKRKPRKFFYHEFFEDDPILAKLKPPPLPPSKARQRWRKVAEHFCGRTWSFDSVRKAYLLMSEHKYADATVALLEAVRMAESSSSRQTPTALLRQVARCYVKYWDHCYDRCCLEKALFYFQRATNSIGALADPRLLQEIAFVSEKLGRYREAAEVISGIIRCFPRYSKLNEVIFRGGIVMIWLGMYQQSREYLLHTLDAHPFGWEQHEILLLAARVMQLEGKPRRKLCAVAYEEAFRKNKRDAYYRLYPTWQEWVKTPTTWREIGDKYFVKHEFALARDAYQVMTKRIFKVKAQRGNLQHQHQVLAAQHASIDGDGEVHPHKLDDCDWLRVARCAAILHDRQAAVTALNQWLARKSYRDRALEQFYKWPLARWRLLGVDVPERVVEILAQKEKAAKVAEAAKLKEMEDKRQDVLRQRSLKVRERVIAWGEETPTNAAASELLIHTVELSPDTPSLPDAAAGSSRTK